MNTYDRISEYWYMECKMTRDRMELLLRSHYENWKNRERILDGLLKEVKI